jgi:predicted enzyme related to lactoylglutathione lyase
MTNPVVHFEMPYEDAARVKKFYEEAFGWGMLPLGAEMGGYVMAHASETDEHNMVKNLGTINGGFYKKNSDAVNTNVVIAVEDIAVALEKVKVAGGAVMDGPTEIPGIGMYANIRDTEGNRVALLQPMRS